MTVAVAFLEKKKNKKTVALNTVLEAQPANSRLQSSSRCSLETQEKAILFEQLSNLTSLLREFIRW